MAGRTLGAMVAFAANTFAGITSTVRIPTGTCIPNIVAIGPEITGLTMGSYASLYPAMLNTPTEPTQILPSSSTSIQSSPTSVVTPTSTAADYLFEVKRSTSVILRDVDNGTSYLGAGGLETSACDQGEIFTLQDNALSSDGLWVSAAPNISWKPFAVSAPKGVMVTNFTLVDRYLTWTNEGFNGGVADFCSLDGTVLVVFNGIAPPDCVAVELLAITTGM